MPKQLLIETRMNSLSLCEGVQPKTKGCLGTISGPCADYKEATRNGNFYSRKLWENVFNDPLVKESLEDRVLIGELDHPGDRLETKATNACIVMTDYSFDDSNGVVNGTFDILDTPNGRILRSLLDYGCKIGVSSRGEGDVTESQGRNNVDEDNYYFVGFDAVVLPAVKKAKPALQESVKREKFKDSLKEQVNLATTKSELELIKKVVEATDMPDVDSIMESINNKSKELEGINSSSNLTEDLETATAQLNKLTEENKSLKQEITSCKSRIKKILESRQKLVGKLNDSKKELESLNKKYNKVVFMSGSSSKEAESLKESVKTYERKISGLTSQLSDVRNKLSEEVSRSNTLEESLLKSQSQCASERKNSATIKKNSDKLVESYEKKIKTLEGKIRELNDKLKTSQRSLKESVKNNEVSMMQYIEDKSRLSGIESKMIKESYRKGMTCTDVDKLIDEAVDRRDRYNKLNIIDDRRVRHSRIESATFSTSEEDIEGNQTLSFMENYYSKK